MGNLPMPKWSTKAGAIRFSISCLEAMQEAVDNLDMDGMGEVIKRFEEIALDGEEKQYLEKMKEAAEGLEVEICEQIVKEWKTMIQL